jgi:hypothetical protein
MLVDQLKKAKKTSIFFCHSVNYVNVLKNDIRDIRGDYSNFASLKEELIVSLT